MNNLNGFPGLIDTLEQHRNVVYGLFHHLLELHKSFLLRSDIQEHFDAYCKKNGADVLRQTPLADIFNRAQEAALSAPWLAFAVRPKIGKWQWFCFHSEFMEAQEISPSQYLKLKEHIVHPGQHEDDWVLEIDLRPFNKDFPRMQDPRSIGKGVEFLNRHLSNRIFNDKHAGSLLLFNFLRVHQCNGQQLMINDRIQNTHQLSDAIDNAIEYLESVADDAPWKDLAHPLQNLGFESGWGKDAARVQDTLSLLASVLQAPDPDDLSKFLSRIPMIFNVVIFSPHGYFAQSGVLGMPDTGGQVVYILDQVKALEREMRDRLHTQGIEIEPNILVVSRLLPEHEHTTCNEPVEPIYGTENARIIRVPFRNQEGEIIPHWISRFHLWEYIERFSIEAEKEVLAVLGTRPDLLIGNYSDGNLVASLMSKRLGITQCNIAHALEKSKYLFSDLYWQEQDEHYHFSTQFTADLIAMNTADFIVTSTYQEITGNPTSVGQYESFSSYTLPGLYRVLSGVNVYDPKFNIVSPGADEHVYYPYTQSEQRLTHLHEEINTLIFGGPGEQTRGQYADPDKPILFTMARFDKIKNLTGFIRWYAESPELRELANVLVIGGYINETQSKDAEEVYQIRTMHQWMDEHQLDGQVRWLGMQLEKNMAGELYRVIADHRGAFIQPALFEAFGLTVVEAMSTGLPTFATLYGGPLEIIVDGKNGFHIDPNHGQDATHKMAEFLRSCQSDPEYWNRISNGAIARVEERYNWKLYASRLMTLARVYGFWKYVTDLDREETHRYLEMIYGLLFRRLAKLE